ncbi:uncharacterized protein MICPUCDRAFT_58878 [Micromonas pusilla CCMP1545]|uniref:Cilia- and flagella-associated protein 251 n=3 Tax=Micromonas pusilla TaxID=38833 RepID=C1MUN9_MICPC|nr:uncharacterized protein MICPUCDRAFT_58878 [Micromonas pusilla CCMP1545]EEH56662.1 predicted protein [Micromonas pusilla CCMP1545]|eukprot:XP_003059530.1 predicted protein [Micromonas pusilla CCMP1545]
MIGRSPAPIPPNLLSPHPVHSSPSQSPLSLREQPDGSTKKVCYIAAHTAVIFDCVSKTQLVLQGHCNPITCLVATADRSYVATADAGPDAMIVVWCVATGEPARTIPSPSPHGIGAMDITPCGKHVAAVSAPPPGFGVSEVRRAYDTETESEHPDAAGANIAAEQEVYVYDLPDLGPAGGDDDDDDGADDLEPSLIGVVPEGDPQVCVKFHPTTTRELATNGAKRVFFWLADGGERDSAKETDDGASNAGSSPSARSGEASFAGNDARVMRYYSPPVSARDFKQTVGGFTVAAFIPPQIGDISYKEKGGGRCVVGTRDGDVVVFDSGGVPPGGAAAAEAIGIKPGDRRAIKILRLHTRGAVTALGVVAAVGPGAASNQTYLVTGGADGNVRFFDHRLRLVAWFDGLATGRVTSVSFTADGAPGGSQPSPSNALAYDSDSDSDVDGPIGKLTAPDFIIGTDQSKVFGLRSAAFEALGSRGAVESAELLAEGTFDPLVTMTPHPHQPRLCCVGAGSWLWLWDYEKRETVVRKDFGIGAHKTSPKHSAAAYRADGAGIFVGTQTGTLKALDPDTLAEVQTMRFTPHRVQKIVVSDDPGCSFAAVSDDGGCVSLFELLGPVREPRSLEEESERVFEFVGKHRAHGKDAHIVGLEFHTRLNGEIELVSCGAEGRLVRFDVKNSTAEGGVKLLGVSDDVLGGRAAGGTSIPTSMRFLPHARDGDGDAGAQDEDEDSMKQHVSPRLLVADDSYKVRTITLDDFVCVKTVLGPTYGGPLSHMTAFGGDAGNTHLVYAHPDKVLGVSALPLDGDPARAMGMIAHPGSVGVVVLGHDGKAVFTIGGGSVPGDAGSVLNAWGVNARALDDSIAVAVEAAGDGVGAVADRFAALLEGGADGEFYREAKDYFLYAQLRAQGEDATRDRAAGLGGTVALSELPKLMRALGHFPTEHELRDMYVELNAEGYDASSSISFDRFVAIYVNHRSVFAVEREDIDAAFEALGADAEIGRGIDRKDLYRTLTHEGEPMTRGELDAAAVALFGEGATLNDLIAKETDARSFAEDVLGFAPAAEDVTVGAAA